jgi:predicted nucleotidyltransferase
MPKKYKTKLRQEVALKKLKSAIERTVYWNENYSKFFHVEEATLVGSLARNEPNVGDIDLCVKVARTQQFSIEKYKKEYIKWRKDILDFAPPRDFSSTLNMYELDVTRFIQNKDGRIEILRWDQLPAISLTLMPIVTLVQNGKFIHDTLLTAISKAEAISHKRAEEIVASDIPEAPYEKKGIYWDSYCNSLSNFPISIRNMILERDNNVGNYQSFMNTQQRR